MTRLDKTLLVAGVTEHLESLKAKCLAAVVGAPGSPLLGWAVSTEIADRWLSVIIKVIGCAGGLYSMWWLWRLNSLEARHKLKVLCEDCLAGYPPAECPVAEVARPAGCPKKLKPKTLNLEPDGPIES